MTARFEKDLFALKPDLVIFQTGLNDALQNKLFEFERDLPIALGILKNKVPSLILMDIQYLGNEQPKIHLKAEDIINRIAPNENIKVLKRFEFMRQLSDKSIVTLDDLLASDKFHLSDKGYFLLSKCATLQIFNK